MRAARNQSGGGACRISCNDACVHTLWGVSPTRPAFYRLLLYYFPPRVGPFACPDGQSNSPSLLSTVCALVADLSLALVTTPRLARDVSACLQSVLSLLSRPRERCV
jgi:hypothetical protein